MYSTTYQNVFKMTPYVKIRGFMKDITYETP